MFWRNMLTIVNRYNGLNSSHTGQMFWCKRPLIPTPSFWGLLPCNHSCHILLVPPGHQSTVSFVIWLTMTHDTGSSVGSVECQSVWTQVHLRTLYTSCFTLILTIDETIIHNGMSFMDIYTECCFINFTNVCIIYRIVTCVLMVSALRTHLDYCFINVCV